MTMLGYCGKKGATKISTQKLWSPGYQDDMKIKFSDMIKRYIDEAQYTRPVHVNVVNCSSPIALCPYLINDSGAVRITQ